MNTSSIFNTLLLAAFCLILPMMLSGQTESDSLSQAKQQEAEIQKRLKEAELKKILFGDNFSKGSTGKGSPGKPDSLLRDSLTTVPFINRRVEQRAMIQTEVEQQGIVVLLICVDSLGSVIAAEYTLKGSTTHNPELIQLCKDNIQLWKFSAAEVEKECGTITYHFRQR
ncbi:MAG TPA: hypothetical protein PKA00_03175 [Saprospiraceae bacterium]|nr:hypothetical protein [Saprospiraceae bacterium]HMQ81877.1 hypothetical protein [Saprospiraceae bacterium]